MELKAIQNLLSRLFTDSILRERAIHAPKSVLHDFGVGEEMADWLKEYAANDGAIFARSLILKRMGMVGSMLPLTKAAMGRQFQEQFREYASNRPTQGIQRHHLDAICFAEWLGSADGQESWLVEMAEYEKIWLESQMARGFFFKYRCYHYAFWATNSRGDFKFPPLRGRPSWVFWMRLSAQSDPIEYRLFPRFWFT